jgi:hypothetical protein
MAPTTKEVSVTISQTVVAYGTSSMVTKLRETINRLLFLTRIPMIKR